MARLKHKQRFILIALLFVLQVGNAQFKLERSARTEYVEFKFIKNLIIIPLTINDKGPFNFIFDTGVAVFLITNPGLIDSLHLNNLRKIKISGFGEGKELEANITNSLDVRIGSQITGSLPAAILTEDAFDLSSYTGIPIHGLIGYEFFNSFIVKINYVNQILRVYNWYQPQRLRKSHTIPLTITLGKPYLKSTVSINGKEAVPVTLIIDTGAGHPAWLESLSGGAMKIPQPNIRANLGVGLTGQIDGYIARIPLLKLGKFELKDVVTAFPDFEDVGAKVSGDRNGNLGNAILKRFDVIFDYKRNLLHLKPNMNFKKPFEHDMSGLELVYHPLDYTRLFIARVETGSAADEAGLLPDDEVLSVNFKKARDWNIDDLQEQLRSRPEKGILMEIARKGEKRTRFIFFELRRRI